MAGFYFQRGAEKAGPFSPEEMAEFLKDGRVGYADLVMREGEDQWRPVHSIPELEGASRALPVARGVASDPPSELPPLASRQTPARASTDGRVAPSRTWTAGQPPRRPGIFLRFTHPLPEVGALLEGAGARFTAVETGRSRVRWSLVAPLLGLMFLLSWIDRQAGFDASVFSALIPYCLVGTLLVVLATRPGGEPTLRGLWEKARHFGLAGIVVLIPVACLGGAILLRALLRLPLLAGILAALAVLVIRWRRKAAPDSVQAPWSTRLSAVTGALEALRDDAAPGKPASGWLDLTGAEQRHKLLARGRSRSGAASEAYRDDWWSLALPLRDGNRLRITASDRLKLKRGRWRRRMRKSKWKPGSERRLSSVEVRLRVNPALYRIVTEPAPYVTISGDTLSTAFDATDGLETNDLLRSLSLLYKRLEPLRAKTVGA